MSAAAHTPTPWVCNPEDDEYGTSTIVDSDNGFIASVGAPFEEIADSNRANGEFIVRACNAHEPLVSALSRIMHYASIGASVCDVDTTEQPEFVAARAALAKAKGSTTPPETLAALRDGSCTHKDSQPISGESSAEGSGA